MKERVLVTGGAGSVGRCVARRLCDDGYAVRIFDLPQMNYADLEGQKGIEIVKGDLAQAADVEKAVLDCGAVIHLAALMRPASEKNRTVTFAVNVEGVARLAEALKAVNPGAPFVFSSSVATYGDTTKETSPIDVNHSQAAIDIYAESKIAAERTLHTVYPGAVVLRISGISVPEIQSPPAVWPFMADQRMEFIHRDDVVTALCTAARMEEAKGRIFNVSGGPTWRMTGQDYVKDYFDLLGVPAATASYLETPGWCDWYDTAAAQGVLGYQNTSYQDHLDRLQKAIDRMMEE